MQRIDDGILLISKSGNSVLRYSLSFHVVHINREIRALASFPCLQVLRAVARAVAPRASVAKGRVCFDFTGTSLLITSGTYLWNFVCGADRVKDLFWAAELSRPFAAGVLCGLWVWLGQLRTSAGRSHSRLLQFGREESPLARIPGPRLL